MEEVGGGYTKERARAGDAKLEGLGGVLEETEFEESAAQYGVGRAGLVAES